MAWPADARIINADAELTSFYIVTAGASATLVGLLFVAVQVGPALAGTDRGIGRRHAMARSTFTIFVLIFALSIFFLVPTSDGAHAYIVLAAASAGVIRAVRTWIPVWRETLSEPTLLRLWQTTWLLIGPVVAYAYLAFGASQQLKSHNDVLDNFTSGAFIVLFVIAMRNSWDLLVEATAESR